MQTEFIIKPEGFFLDGLLDAAPDTSAFLELYKKNKWEWLYQLAWNHSEQPSLSERFLIDVSELFHRIISSTPDIELLRERAEPAEYDRELEDFLNLVPFIIGHEHVTKTWIENIVARLTPIFQKEIQGFSGKVEHYYEDKIQNLSVPDRLFFHLVEAKEGKYPFAFLLTYSEAKGRQIVHQPFTQALKSYADDREKLISLMASILKIEKESSLIHGLMESGELFHPIGLDVEEAYTFLKEIPLYEKNGVVCRIPNWWKTRQNALFVSLKIDNEKSFLSAQNLIHLRPGITDGVQDYTREEIEDFLRSSEGLRMIKGKWVEINHEKLKALLEDFDALADRHSEALTITELIKESANAKSESNVYIPFARELTKRLQRMEDEKLYPLPSSFNGELRSYQELGRNWLHRMDDLKLGVCLADDMGLGKTVQIIAYLDAQREQNKKYLLVLPTSLIGNWESELERFAPEVTFSVYHGLNKEIDDFLTITSYGTLRNDLRLKEEKWDGVILDEAHAIKNPTTKQTQAVKSLSADMKIAMTGTPIENNLLDLYSLFDFINPGIFGRLNDFKKAAKDLDKKPEGYERLKTMVRPFMLRRLKTDPSIVSDLPEKIESIEYIDISQKQLALYNRVLKTMAQSLAGSEGMQRRGLILSAIQSMKQILNHPSQYTADGEYKPSDSGKFLRLGELCQTIYENRERVLVFTQYRELTEPLARYLEGIFKVPGKILHGGVTPKQRTKMVEEFNSADEYVPFMVLSLKAGGVGLNLTAANHVIHFDRWWNPAVENQATDRAFRIGQERNVFVYKFLVRKTMEEKIDRLIQSKVDLADAIVQENKAPAITELSNAEVMNLFSIG
ncbi:MAG: DEAD/DEAH box helicase [Bacillota bacterium]|nr:DEAD/DEAH box helicase [Bacillota bacterium]